MRQRERLTKNKQRMFDIISVCDHVWFGRREAETDEERREACYNSSYCFVESLKEVKTTHALSKKYK